MIIAFVIQKGGPGETMFVLHLAGKPATRRQRARRSPCFARPVTATAPWEPKLSPQHHRPGTGDAAPLVARIRRMRGHGVDACSHHLTMEVTGAMRGRVKVAGFRHGAAAGDVLSRQLARVSRGITRFAMTQIPDSRSRGGAAPDEHRPGDLTHVELTWVAQKIEYWIRFGHAAGEQILDRHRRIVAFAPNTVFAFVRWAANDYGTVLSRIDVVRAVAPGEACQTLPFVRPGGEILLKIEGWHNVEKILRHVDAAEALGIDPADVAPDHWRHIAHWMSAGQAPRPYTGERHRAWLRRREIGR